MKKEIEQNIDENGRMLAEALRSVSLRHFRALADLMPPKVAMTDTSGKTIFLNKQWLEYTGQTEAEALSTVQLFVHPDEQEVVQSHVEECMRNLKPYRRETRLRNSKGEYRWHLTTAQPYFDENGEVHYWISTSTDIEETKQLQARLEQMNAELEKRVVERTAMLHEAEAMAHLGSWSWDVESNNIQWSDEMYRIFGLEPGGRPIGYQEYLELIHPDSKALIHETVQNAISQKHDYRVEHRIRRPDGTVRILDGKGKVITDAQGNVIKLTGTAQDVTEQREAEDTVRRTDEMYRTLAANIPDGFIILFDKDLRFNIAEGRGLELAGHNKQAMEGHTLYESFSEEVVDFFAPIYKRALSGERVVLNQKSHTGHIFNITFLPIYNKVNEVSGGVAVGFDVTELTKTQDELRRAKDLSENIIRNSLDGISAFDTEQRYTVWNPFMEKFSRLGSEKVLGEKVLDIFPMLREGSFEQMLADVLGGSPVHHKAINLDGRGRQFLDLSLVPLRDSEGIVIGGLSILKDVTGQWKYEETLRQHKEQLQEAQALAHIGSFVYYPEEKRLECSDEFYRIYGFEPGGVVFSAEMLFSLVPEEDHAALIGGFSALREGKKPKSFTHRVKRQDGSLRLVEGVSKPVVADDGLIVKINGYIQDVTDKREAEALLQKKNEELQRTNQELEQFAYIASHDMKEPLRMISTYIQLLEKRMDGLLNDETREYMGYAVEGARRMQALINDLLEYSKVGRYGVNKEVADCGLIVEQVVQSLQRAILENHAHIIISGMPQLRCMSTAIRQVFQNLVQNALKFRSEEAPIIQISARKQGRYWLFSVQDNGIGISPAYFERIFTLFQRLHSREKYDGTGIGLAICKKVIELHEGNIWVESEPGKGTTFFFTLPA